MISNTLDSSFCIDALEEAIKKHGCPDIFNTDQGSQFTAEALTNPHRIAETGCGMNFNPGQFLTYKSLFPVLRNQTTSQWFLGLWGKTLQFPLPVSFSP